MTQRFIPLALVVTLAAGSTAVALDEVHVVGRDRPQLGVIRSVDREGVSIEANQQTTKFSVAEIRWVVFDQDPFDLKEVRPRIRQDAAYAEGLERLNNISSDEIVRSESNAEVDFYKALCQVQLAMAGTGSVKEAGGAMLKFIRDHQRNYNYYEANELLGNLLRADGRHADAITFYNRVAESSALALRAKVAIGWANLEQGKSDEARAAFQEVLNGDGPDARRQKNAARIGMAAATAESDPSKAVQTVEAAVAETDPDDTQLNARMYNVLGYCYQKAGRPKDAILAYLHVDILYPHNAVEHAEALGNLAALWAEVNHAERSTQANRTLRSRYPNSRWVK